MTLALKVGGTYRAKHPRPVARFLGQAFFNDRQIKWISQDGSRIQYDGPAVPFGRSFPIIDRNEFLAWADKELPEELDNAITDEWEIWK